MINSTDVSAEINEHTHDSEEGVVYRRASREEIHEVSTFLDHSDIDVKVIKGAEYQPQ